MTDLVSWLSAQMDADEAHARKDLWALNRATPGRWEAYYGHNLPYSLIMGEGGVEVARFVAGTVPLPDGADDLHAADILLVVRLVRKARERAEATLRTIAAHRAILAEHRPTLTGVEWPHDTTGKGEALTCPRCQNAEHTDWRPLIGMAGVLPEGFVAPYVLAPCRTLVLLAAIYEGRDGWDPAWKVEA